MNTIQNDVYTIFSSKYWKIQKPNAGKKINFGKYVRLFRLNLSNQIRMSCCQDFVVPSAILQVPSSVQRFPGNEYDLILNIISSNASICWDFRFSLCDSIGDINALNGSEHLNSLYGECNYYVNTKLLIHCKGSHSANKLIQYYWEKMNIIRFTMSFSFRPFIYRWVTFFAKCLSFFFRFFRNFRWQNCSIILFDILSKGSQTVLMSGNRSNKLNPNRFYSDCISNIGSINCHEILWYYAYVEVKGLGMIFR